jgi:hypothetical protein
MTRTQKRDAGQADPAEQEIRDQEVLRANRDLAAYFRGRRTEREARSALKIIKAFIRDRERVDPANRRPLPGVPSATVKTRPRKSGSPTPAKESHDHSPDSQHKAPRRAAPTDATSLMNGPDVATDE